MKKIAAWFIKLIEKFNELATFGLFAIEHKPEQRGRKNLMVYSHRNGNLLDSMGNLNAPIYLDTLQDNPEPDHDPRLD